MGAALRFVEELGAERIRCYCHELVASAAEKIARAWAQPLDGPPAMHGAMMAIRLPPAWQGGSRDQESASRLQSRLMAEQRIAVAIAAIDGALWARISAQIYNELGDYERLLQACLHPG